MSELLTWVSAVLAGALVGSVCFRPRMHKYIIAYRRGSLSSGQVEGILASCEQWRGVSVLLVAADMEEPFCIYPLHMGPGIEEIKTVIEDRVSRLRLHYGKVG